MFIISKGCASHAWKEHYALCVPSFRLQLQFMHDEEGQVFLHYQEEIGFKTNKGGIKHSKLDPKQVDIYPIDYPDRYPLYLFLKFFSVLPFNRELPSIASSTLKEVCSQHLVSRQDMLELIGSGM